MSRGIPVSQRPRLVDSKFFENVPRANLSSTFKPTNNPRNNLGNNSSKSKSKSKSVSYRESLELTKKRNSVIFNLIVLGLFTTATIYYLLEMRRLKLLKEHDPVPGNIYDKHITKVRDYFK